MKVNNCCYLSVPKHLKTYKCKLLLHNVKNRDRCRASRSNHCHIAHPRMLVLSKNRIESMGIVKHFPGKEQSGNAVSMYLSFYFLCH